VKAIAAVLFVALMGSGLAHSAGDLPPSVEKRSVPLECDETQCLVAIEDLAAIKRANDNLAALAFQHQERVMALEAELSKLRAIKGCGKLEVVPKPKVDQHALYTPKE
jgi:hypothetical protein